ncbi:MAG: PilZ domain-containing protein, partial [Acidobacteriota bacterium]
EVSYTVDPSSGRPGGVGLHLHEFDLEAARRARAAIRAHQNDELLRPPEQRGAVRIPARLRVRYRGRKAFEQGLTRDISNGGAFLRTDEPYPVGTALDLVFVRPPDGRELLVPAEVVRDPVILDGRGPGIGMGIRFRSMDVRERRNLERFVGYVDLRRRAHTAAEVRGRLQDAGVEGIIHLFCGTDRSGELVLRARDGAGRIEFRDSRILRAELPEAGVHGERALFRMMTWEQGDFEYRRRAVPEGGDLERRGAQLVREGLQIRARLAAWRQRLPGSRRIAPGPRWQAVRLEAVPQTLRPFLETLPTCPTVAQSLDRLGRNDLDAYRILGTLHQRGLIRLPSAAPGR